MSSPWCQSPETSPRNAPNVSPKDEGPYTGNTYPPAVSFGVMFGGRMIGVIPGLPSGAGACCFACPAFFGFGFGAGGGAEACAATSA
jgi:hypothetical protein